MRRTPSDYALSQILGPNGQPYAVAQAQKPDVRSRGFTGIQRYGGLITEEYLPALSGGTKIDTYTKMRSDGLVEALLTALRLPIVAATWDVEAASDSPHAKAAKELVEDQLFRRLVWEDEVRNFLTYLQYGFSVLVKQWVIIDGTATLAELRPLHPRTILQGGKNWTYDDHGKLTGVWQYGTDGKVFREEWIPAGSFVHFVHEGDFGNPEGRGVLRACYKHWWMVDTLYRIWAIGLERGAIGTPIGTYPSNASEEDQETLFNFVKALVAYEDSGAVFPADTVLTNFAVETKTADIKEFITHHKTEMAKSILAQWLMLGTDGQGGAYALSADSTDLFLLSLEAIARYVAAKANRELIPQIVGYNLATDEYPRLTATISRESTAMVAQTIRNLTAGVNPVIQVDEGIEDHMREKCKFPPRMGPRKEPQPKALPPGQTPPKAAEQQQSRRLIHLQLFADPPQFTEEPQIEGLPELLGEFRGQVQTALNTLWETVRRIVGLPDPTFAQVLERDTPLPKLTARQNKLLDTAIETFLTELAGADQSAEGFADSEVDDALLQSYARLAHALGVQETVRLTGAATSRFVPTRDSPQIRVLLEAAFQRLSKQGTQRLLPYLGEIKELLAQATIDGEGTYATAEKLAQRFEQFSRYEMERLVRTELGYAATAGSLDEMQAEGVRSYSWVVSALACAVCQGFAGVKYLVGQGPTPPGDSHPQCFCSVKPEV